ncbi:hypothetical protein E3P99_02302 [Wallemia hederae]|uniref:Methyltransferase small domain-containing protein n=1 Tax=Wallemia hederae TaxID=1540922 RepID=A0A4T0FKL6_9BASI|nr:hypothetical protein E3P99_02302 [Wallemia hederae]
MSGGEKVSVPTPDLSHLKAADYARVYEPSEDTFALLDALEMDYWEIRTQQPRICYEIGSGSGCVIAFVASILKSSCLYVAADINEHASKCTQATATRNGYSVQAINANLMDCLRLERSVDLLLFNPPYVPTEEEEYSQSQLTKQLSSALSGGNLGMELTELVLSRLDTLLSPNGALYLVAIRQNKPEEICQRLNDTGNFTASILLKRRAGIELLHIIKCSPH